MRKNCVICGTKLEITNLGNWFCMNCGIIEVNQDIKEEKNGKKKSYIGWEKDDK